VPADVDLALVFTAAQRVPDVIADSGVPFHTSDTIMRIDDVPEHLVIVGSGYIAAEFAHVSLPAASRLVDDLVRRGLVDRQEDAADRRMKGFALTDDGRSIIRRVNAGRLSGLEAFIESLSGGERTKLSAALAELLKRQEVGDCRP